MLRRRTLKKQICIIGFILWLSIAYLIYRNTQHTTFITSFTNHHPTTRTHFLNHTFCGKLITNTYNTTINHTHINIQSQMLKQHIQHSLTHFINLSCAHFITEYGFYSKPITTIEHQHPMAFTILVYKHLYQFQVLMRTLYVRTNYHCIHVDKRAPLHLYLYAYKLSICLDNIHIIESRLAVDWGSMNILHAERLCQTYLLKQSSKWHYHMTIAGTELPIQTNLNRIQILALVPDQSRNDVVSFPQPYNRQASKKRLPPNNMTVYKGEFHSILTRDFIHAVHTDRIALEFWSYLNGTNVPDEQFYPSLVRLSHLPGGRSRIVPSYHYADLVSHYKVWQDSVEDICQSNEYVNGICQFNYKDLSRIEKSGRLFANKFNENLDLVGIDCWEKWFHVKESDGEDINGEDYLDKYPFMRRKPEVAHKETINKQSK